MARNAKALYPSTQTRYVPYSVAVPQRNRCTAPNVPQYHSRHAEDPDYLYSNSMPNTEEWYNGSTDAPESTGIEEDCIPQSTSDYIGLVSQHGLPFEKLCKDCQRQALIDGSATSSMVTTPEEGTSRYLPSDNPWAGEVPYSQLEYTPPPIHIIDSPEPSQNARVTTPEKPFDCHFCNKDFPKKADRDRHEASVHRNEMPMPPGLHDCPEENCTRDKGFTRKDNLLDHLRRVHNKDIPKRRPASREYEENKGKDS